MCCCISFFFNTRCFGVALFFPLLLAPVVNEIQSLGYILFQSVLLLPLSFLSRQRKACIQTCGRGPDRFCLAACLSSGRGRAQEVFERSGLRGSNFRWCFGLCVYKFCLRDWLFMEVLLPLSFFYPLALQSDSCPQAAEKMLLTLWCKRTWNEFLFFVFRTSLWDIFFFLCRMEGFYSQHRNDKTKIVGVEEPCK